MCIKVVDYFSENLDIISKIWVDWNVRSTVKDVTNLGGGVKIRATRGMKQTRSVDGIIWFNMIEWFQLHVIRNYTNTDGFPEHTVNTQTGIMI